MSQESKKPPKQKAEPKYESIFYRTEIERIRFMMFMGFSGY